MPIKIKQIKHIFFDLDNTLWDFEKNSREALLHLFLEHNIQEHCQTNFDNFIEIYEAINHEMWHLYSLHQTTKEELRYQHQNPHTFPPFCFYVKCRDTFQN